MLGQQGYYTHTQFLNSLSDVFNSPERARQFEHEWRLNYVNRQTIIDLKELGYNSVRVPFHWEMFWENGRVSNKGFEYIDRLVRWCREQEMWILLDMHAAPGYQNPGDHSDNLNSNDDQPRSSVGFWDGDNVEIASKVWKHLANKYKDETMIWGYDLLNEPVLPSDSRHPELLKSFIRMKDAIREVDKNHIIVVEGAWWSSNLYVLDWTNGDTQRGTGVMEKWDDKLVYQTHHYIGGNKEALEDLYVRDDITNRLNVPLILGEYGEDSDEIIKAETDWAKANIAGAFPWSFKKMYFDKCLWTIEGDEIYNQVRDYILGRGSKPSNAFDGMIEFARNNIGNGPNSGHVFHEEFYRATVP